MTRKEKLLKHIKEHIDSGMWKYESCYLGKEDLEIIIKALKQEPSKDILDKIRAEIEALNPVDYVSMSSYEGHKGASDMKDDILQIIDKYKEG